MADEQPQTPAQAKAAGPPPKQRSVEDEQARMMQVTSSGDGFPSASSARCSLA